MLTVSHWDFLFLPSIMNPILKSLITECSGWLFFLIYEMDWIEQVVIPYLDDGPMCQAIPESFSVRSSWYDLHKTKKSTWMEWENITVRWISSTDKATHDIQCIKWERMRYYWRMNQASNEWFWVIITEQHLWNLADDVGQFDGIS